MKKTVLSNGLTVLTETRNGKSVAVQVSVKVGSINETTGERGISHFLEHMVFEGTKKRTALQIVEEIERLGGEISAFTSAERTCFYVKVLDKYFEHAVEVLSDIIKNPTFKTKLMEKERKVILSEIKLVTDEPRWHQWVLFEKALYKNSTLANPTYGTVEDIRGMRRKNLVDYHHKYYVPENMAVSFVGPNRNAGTVIKKYFGDMQKRKKPLLNIKINVSSQRIIEKKPVMQSYLVLGYNTGKRAEKDSYTLDVIRAVLGKGLSGKLFQEIRQKRGLAYDVGVNNETGFDYGFFAVYLGTDKKNLKKAEGLVIKELRKLQKLTARELFDAKKSIEGEYILANEDNREMADNLGSWEMSSDAFDSERYVKRIQKVSLADVRRVAKKYFTKDYAAAIIENP